MAAGLPAPRAPLSEERTVFERLERALTDPTRRRASLLLGPRQVGKTVLLRQVARSLLDDGVPPGNITYFDFSDPRSHRAIGAIEPESIADHVPANADAAAPRYLLLDEIHGASEWPRWLKQVVDEDRPQQRSMLRILATDSAASVLSHAAVETGQGRWDEERLFGLSFMENLRLLSYGDESEADAFARAPNELEAYLAKGGLPEHVRAEPSETLRRSIREDVVEKAVQRDLLIQGGASRLSRGTRSATTGAKEARRSTSWFTCEVASRRWR